MRLEDQTQGRRVGESGLPPCVGRLPRVDPIVVVVAEVRRAGVELFGRSSGFPPGNWRDSNRWSTLQSNAHTLWSLFSCCLVSRSRLRPELWVSRQTLSIPTTEIAHAVAGAKYESGLEREEGLLSQWGQPLQEKGPRAFRGPVAAVRLHSASSY